MSNTAPPEDSQDDGSIRARATMIMAVRDWDKAHERYAPEPSFEEVMVSFLIEEVENQVPFLEHQVREMRETLSFATDAVKSACSTVDELNDVAKYLLLGQTESLEAFPDRQRVRVSEALAQLQITVHQHKQQLDQLTMGVPNELMGNLHRMQAVEQYVEWKLDDKENAAFDQKNST